MNSKTDTPPLPQNLKPLSPKEKGVLDFVTSYFLENGHSPSYQEIKDHFGLASFNSVQNYLKQLQNKSYVRLFPGQKRCIEILQTSDALKDKILSFSKKTELPSDSQDMLLQNSLSKSLPKVSKLRGQREVLSSPHFELPYLGRVAAGNPIERTHENETLDVIPMLVKQPESTFVVRVEGDSMIEEGINDSDFILVQEQSYAKNGDIVVASVDNEATVKRIYYKAKSNLNESQKIELRPSNSRLKSFFYDPSEVIIKGIVVGLMRKF
ncbi:MAG: repressor LexA [Bdellovibrionaceae bacterium]|nr:repressor LexA [Pseudobdellovibrionaceae bacterium]